MRSAAAVLVGAGLYAAALPPFDWAIFGWFALVPLLLAVRGRSVRYGFAVGTIYGVACAWGVAGWLAQALSRYFGLGMAVGIIGASGYALMFWGTAFGAFGAGASIVLNRKQARSARVAIAALWVATELLRGRVFGQPWGLIGYSQHQHIGLIQLAAVTAVYGVSFLLAFANESITEAIVLARVGRRRDAATTLAVAVIVVGAVWLAGSLVAVRGPTGGFQAHPVAIVQTNVPPAYQWTPAYTEREILAHIRATDRLSPYSRPALVVWPENSVPRYVETDPMLASELGAVASRHGADLLFGAPRYDGGHTYNSVRLISASGRSAGTYDKQRLVLFAEANPLSTAPDADPDGNPTRFTAGHEPGVLPSFVPLGVSICHEVLFPELVAASVASGAQLLINVSNDGWLDAGTGVAGTQHFAMAVFRAVETRRYLIRAATTGVSGIVDPYGAVIETLPPRSAGVITSSVAGRRMLTPYVRFGDVFAFACAAGAVLAIVGRRAPVVRRYPSLAPSGPASS